MNFTNVGTWDGTPQDYNDIWGYVDGNNNEYALIGSSGAIHVVQVNTPSPSLVGTIIGGGSSSWRDIKTYGTYAYSVIDNGGATEGLTVIDLSNLPTSVSMHSQLNTDFHRAHNIFIDEPNARLYVVGSSGGSNSEFNGMIVYSLANPAVPVRIANLDLSAIGGGYVHDVFVRNNIAYASHGTNINRLVIYDLTNLAAPVVQGVLTSYPSMGYNHSGWLSDDGNWYVFADETFGSELKIANVSDPTDITVMPNNVFQDCLVPNSTGCMAHNPFIKGNIAYVSYYADGMKAFDISDPSNVTLVGYYDTFLGNTGYPRFEGAWGTYPYLPSGKVLVSDIATGLYVLQPSAALPVEMAYFRGKTVEQGVQLDWQTATELNNDFFEVQRSRDGITFQTLTTIRGQGTTLDPTNYEYLDKMPLPGTSYYRLRQQDYDGAFEYTRLVTVTAYKPGTITVYPTVVSAAGNPITVELGEIPVDPVQLTWFNAQGQIVAQRTKSVFTKSFTVDSPAISSGILLLDVQSGTLKAQTKIIVH